MRKTIIEFDLSSQSNDNLRKATLQLELVDIDGTFNITVSRLRDTEWSEHAATWNNFDPSVLLVGGSIEGDQSLVGTKISVDVTDLVRESTDSSVTFLLEDVVTRRVNAIFSSKESVSGAPPQLVLVP